MKTFKLRPEGLLTQWCPQRGSTPHRNTQNNESEPFESTAIVTRPNEDGRSCFAQDKSFRDDTCKIVVHQYSASTRSVRHFSRIEFVRVGGPSFLSTQSVVSCFAPT